MKTLICILLFVCICECHSFNNSCSSEARCRCLTHGSLDNFVADCSNLGLTVSPIFFINVSAINLSRNHLNRIPAQRKLPEKLQHLDLSHNNFSSFVNEENVFLRMPNLISLNLSSNNIVTTTKNYDERVFQNFTRLKVLDVSNNTNYYVKIWQNQLLDSVWTPLVSLEQLKIDAIQNVTFGESIANLTKLSKLTLAGQCALARLTTIEKDYFKKFPYLRNLDMSSNVYYDPVKHYLDYYLCSLQQIHSGAISVLQDLEILDISYNRLLGLCGFRNISYDLPYTNIKVFKANFLHCESGMSLTLFCDDVKPFKNTSLRELHMDGNHLAFGQTGMLQYIPQSLERLSIRSNRWVVDQYTHVFLEFLYGIKNVDISNLNDHQMSRSTNIYEYCHNFLATANCQKYRSQSMGSAQPPNDWGACILTPPQANTTVDEQRIEVRHTESEHSKPFCSINFDLHNLYVLFKKLPPFADTIILNNSRLGLELTWTVFRNDTLTSLILSHNQFYSMMGPICNATKLKHLDLSHNRCSRISTYVFEYQPNLETLLLNDNLIGDSNLFEDENMTNIFANQTSLKVLNLTSNKLQWLPRDMFWNLRKLRHLRLDKNKLSDWNFTVGHMLEIEVVNLSMNSILSISKQGTELIDQCQSPNLTIDLSRNTLQCTCKTQKFIEWMFTNSKKFWNFNSYCFDCNGMQSCFDLKSAKEYLSKQCSSYFSLILACSCLCMAFLCLILVVILYRYRFKLRYWYYIKLRFDSAHVDSTDSRQYRFDAFISYADEDRSFAIEQMLENLEKKEGLRLCIHHRDFMPGTSIIENISNAIHCSSKVVFVMTNSFLKSEWCMYEFQATKAESQYSFSRQGNMMLFLMRERILVRKIPSSIQNMLDTDTYIEYPVNSEDEPEFWVTLSKAILD